MNILEAIDDPRLFGGALREPVATWRPWRAFLGALFGLPLSEAEADLFRVCTGRAALPASPFAEVWLCCGRRAGKSFVLALIAVYLAVFHDYSPYLGPGERGTIMIVAADRRQARVIMRYVKALLAIAAFADLVTGETAESIDLSNRVTIEVGTASFKSLRGYTIIAALADEIAFWPQEDAAAPDEEILAALRPAMATIPGAMLLCASSPYAKKGALWRAYKRYYAVDDPSVLVWKAATRTMNATVPQRIIDDARERDPAAAASEYDGEFRSDISNFLDIAIIESAVDRGVAVRPPRPSIIYNGFADAASGSGKDSYAAVVCHAEGDVVVIDAVFEARPPFNPQNATAEAATLFKSYKIRTVTGDKYSAGFLIEAFSRHSIEYRYCERDTSSNYLESLPLFTSGRVRLVDNQRLIAQFAALERRTSVTGRDRVSHSDHASAHDDLAAACAGAIAAKKVAPMKISQEVLRRSAIPPSGFDAFNFH